MATEEVDNGAGSAVSPPLEEAIADRLNVQQLLDQMEEILLSSPHIPFSRRTLVDEDALIEQLDRIRLSLPSAFKEAVQIVQQRQMILAEAERYSRELLAATDEQVAQRLDEMGIIRQAEAEAQALRQQAQQDYESLRAQMTLEMEQWQEATRSHWEQIRQETEAECDRLKAEADTYAAQLLQALEQQLTGMLRVVRNGQQLLPQNEPPPSAPPAGEPQRRREGGRGPKPGDRPRRT